MTQRKPLEHSFESWIEGQIRVAQEQGAFDNLPGAGKPLPDAGHCRPQAVAGGRPLPAAEGRGDHVDGE